MGLREFSWQAGYGAFSVDKQGLFALRQYIENQEEHHRKFTFKEEFLKLLDEHHLEYNEKYLWE